MQLPRPLPFLTRILFCLPAMILLPCLAVQPAGAQESEQVCISGKRYLDINIHALDKYARRAERVQGSLLARLRRKERRLGRQLMHKDSAAYVRYKATPLIYDSISKLAAARPDTGTAAAKALRAGNGAVDTLQGVYRFVQSKAGALSSAPGSLTNTAGLQGYSARINRLRPLQKLRSLTQCSRRRIFCQSSARVIDFFESI